MRKSEIKTGKMDVRRQKEKIDRKTKDSNVREIVSKTIRKEGNYQESKECEENSK